MKFSSVSCKQTMQGLYFGENHSKLFVTSTNTSKWLENCIILECVSHYKRSNFVMSLLRNFHVKTSTFISKTTLYVFFTTMLISYSYFNTMIIQHRFNCILLKFHLISLTVFQFHYFHLSVSA